MFDPAVELLTKPDGAGRTYCLSAISIRCLNLTPFQKFEQVDATIVRGPGTADMKGGIVVALAALAALKNAGVLDRLHITFVLNGDKEDSGAPRELARRTLIDAAKAADIGIAGRRCAYGK